MSLAGLPEWVSELISKGESVSACLSLYKEMQATEREERVSLEKASSALPVSKGIKRNAH
jgi:hypothetical protein